MEYYWHLCNYYCFLPLKDVLADVDVVRTLTAGADTVAGIDSVGFDLDTVDMETDTSYFLLPYLPFWSLCEFSLERYVVSK